MVSGKNTWQLIFALLQYAAAETPALPAEGKQIVSTFCSFAIVIAKDIPLSLNDPVGFTVSFLTNTFSEIGTKGVNPSPSETLCSTLGRTAS